MQKKSVSNKLTVFIPLGVLQGSFYLIHNLLGNLLLGAFLNTFKTCYIYPMTYESTANILQLHKVAAKL